MSSDGNLRFEGYQIARVYRCLRISDEAGSHRVFGGVPGLLRQVPRVLAVRRQKRRSQPPLQSDCEALSLLARTIARLQSPEVPAGKPGTGQEVVSAEELGKNLLSNLRHLPRDANGRGRGFVERTKRSVRNIPDRPLSYLSNGCSGYETVSRKHDPQRRAGESFGWLALNIIPP